MGKLKRNDQREFKYKSFNELVNIEINYEIKKKIDQNDTYLNQTFMDWVSENSWPEFIDFKRSIQSKIQTTRILRSNGAEVCEKILDFLKNCNKHLSILAALDMLKALICDIRGQFYPYMARTMAIIEDIVINRIDNSCTINSEYVIAAFTCITQLFNNLKQEVLTNNYKDLLKLSELLLFHKKPYLRNFMSQCIAFILQKLTIEKFAESVEFILNNYQANQYSDESIAKILSNCLYKNQNLVSTSNSMFYTIYLNIIDVNNDNQFYSIVFEQLFKDLMSNINEIGYKYIMAYVTEYPWVNYQAFLFCFENIFKYGNGKKLLGASKDLMDSISSIVEKTNESSSEKITSLVQFIVKKLPDAKDIERVMASAINHPLIKVSHKFELFNEIAEYPCFDRFIKITLNCFLKKLTVDNKAELSNELCEELLDLMLQTIDKFKPISSELIWKNELKQNRKNLFNLCAESNVDTLETVFYEILLRCKERVDGTFSKLCLILPHIYPLNSNRHIIDLLGEICKNFDFRGNLALGIILINSYSLICEMANHQIKLDINVDFCWEQLAIMKLGNCKEGVMMNLLGMVYLSDENQVLNINDEMIQERNQILMKRLCSANHKTRYHALVLLQLLNHKEAEVVHYMRDVAIPLELTLNGESVELIEKQRHISKILLEYRPVKTMEIKKTPSFVDNLKLFQMLGCLHIQFKPLVKMVIETLGLYNNYLLYENVLWSGINPVFNNELEDEKLFDTSDGNYTENYILEMFCINKNIEKSYSRIKQIRTIILLLNALPNLANRKTSVICPLIFDQYNKLLNKSIVVAPTASSGSVEDRSMSLVSCLDLMASLPNKEAIFKRDVLLECCENLLTGTNIQLQNAALKYILSLLDNNMAERYSEKFLNAFGENNSIKFYLIRNLQLDSLDRECLVPVFYRLLFGFCRNKKFSNNRNNLIQTLCDNICGFDELNLLMEIIIKNLVISCGEIEKNGCTGIFNGMNLIKSYVESLDDAEIMFVILNKMASIIEFMDILLKKAVSKFSVYILEDFMKAMISIYELCLKMKKKYSRESKLFEEMEVDEEEQDEEVEEMMEENVNEDEEEEEEEDVIDEFKKIMSPLNRMRKSVGKMIIFYFSKFSEEIKESGEEVIEMLNSKIVSYQMDRLCQENVTSLNLTMRLCSIWSKSSQLRFLITGEIYCKLVELLRHQKLNRELVGSSLVDIITSILKSAQDPSELNTLNVSLQDGSLLRSQIKPIVEYTGNRIAKVKLAGKINKLLRSEMDLLIISGQFLGQDQNIDQEMLITLSLNIISYITTSNKIPGWINFKLRNNESQPQSSEVIAQNKSSKTKLEVDFLNVLETVLSNCKCDGEGLEKLMERMLYLLSRVVSFASRMILLRIMKNLWTKLNSQWNLTVNLNELLGNLNRIVSKNSDEADVYTIESTLSAFTEEYLQSSKFQELYTNPVESNCQVNPKLWPYVVVAHCCMYYLANEKFCVKDSISVIGKLLNLIKETQSPALISSVFTEKLWPLIWHGLNHNDVLKREHYYMLMKSSIQLKVISRFEELESLVRTENNNNSSIINNIAKYYSIYEREAGLRQFNRFINKGKSFDINNIREIFLPILLGKIQDEYCTKADVKFSEGNVEPNLEGLSILCKHLPQNLYKSLLNSFIEDLNKYKSNKDMTMKVIIACLDGFSLDISDKAVVEYMQQMLQDLQSHLPKEDKQRKQENEAKELDDEEMKTQRDLRRDPVNLVAPLAYSIVNVALKLPKKYMKFCIQNIIRKVCEFLKNMDEKVRKEAGACLAKILLKCREAKSFKSDLCMEFFHFLVEHLRRSMFLGRQRFIGLNTVNRILNKLVEKEKATPTLDNKMETDDEKDEVVLVNSKVKLDYKMVEILVEWYMDDLFGEMAKERRERREAKVAIIPEGKNSQSSIDKMRVVAELIGDEEGLYSMISLLWETAEGLDNAEALKRMKNVFDSISGAKSGIIANMNFDPIALFTMGWNLLMKLQFISVKKQKNQKKGKNGNLNENEMAGGEEEEDTESLFNKEEFYTKAGALLLFRKSRRYDGWGEELDCEKREEYLNLLTNCGLKLMYNTSIRERDNDQINLVGMLQPVFNPLIAILKDEKNIQTKETNVIALKLLQQMIQLNLLTLDSAEDLVDLLLDIYTKLIRVKLMSNTLDLQRIKLVNSILIQIINRGEYKLTESQMKLINTGVKCHAMMNVNSLTTEYEQIERFSNCLPLLRALIDDKMNCELAISSDVFNQDIMSRVKEVALKYSGGEVKKIARGILVKFYEKMALQKDLLEMILEEFKELVQTEEVTRESKLAMFEMFTDIIGMPGVRENENMSDLFIYYILALLVKCNLSDDADVVENYLELSGRYLNLLDNEKQMSILDAFVTEVLKCDCEDTPLGEGLYFLINSAVKLCQKHKGDGFDKQLERKTVQTIVQAILNEKLAVFVKNMKETEEILEAVKGEDSEMMMDIVDNEQLKETSDKLKYYVNNIEYMIGCLSVVLRSDLMVGRELSTSLVDNKLIVETLLVSKHTKLRDGVLRYLLDRSIDINLGLVNNKRAHSLSSRKKLAMNCEVILKKCLGSMLDAGDNLLDVEAELIVQVVVKCFKYLLTGVKLEELSSADILEKVLKLANKVATEEMEGSGGLLRRRSVLRILDCVLEAFVEGKSNYETQSKLFWENIVWQYNREQRRLEENHGKNNNERATDLPKMLDSIKVKLVTIFNNDEEKLDRFMEDLEKRRKIMNRKRCAEKASLKISNVAEPILKKQRKNQERKTKKKLAHANKKF